MLKLVVPLIFIYFVYGDLVSPANKNSILHSPQCYCVLPSMMLCYDDCQRCDQLDKYLNDTISNNTCFRFYSGTHYLNQSLKLKNIHDVKFIAYEDESDNETVIIRCMSEDIGLKFLNVTGLQIEGLKFSNCSTVISDEDYQITSALIFYGGENLTLTSVIINEPSTVAGISIVCVTGSVHIQDSLFANARILNESLKKGNLLAYDRCNREAILSIQSTVFENNDYDFKLKMDEQYLSAGLSIILSCRNVTINFSNLTLRENGGCTGGNLAVLIDDTYKPTISSEITIDNSLIESGRGNLGGGIFIQALHKSSKIASNINSTHIKMSIRNTTFRNNCAHYGGGIYLKHNETLLYSGVINIDGCVFENNHLSEKPQTVARGFALHFVISEYRGFYRPQLKLSVSHSNFTKHGNDEISDNAVILINTTSPYNRISNTNITNNKCTGLMVVGSNVIISNNVNIIHNKAHRGGGILLGSHGVLYFQKETQLMIANNSVSDRGGGIYIEKECYLSKPQCFFQLDSEVNKNKTLMNSIKVTVTGNSAGCAGENIYGGLINKCHLINDTSYSFDVYKKIFNSEENINTRMENSSITSDPRQILVFGNKTNPIHFEIYSGGTFFIKVVIVGQLNGTVPGSVYAKFQDHYKQVFLRKGNSIQEINSRAPTTLSYRIYSKKTNINATLILSVEDSSNPYSKNLEVKISIKDCPLGYLLQKQGSQSKCTCDNLKKYVNNKISKLKCYISRRVGIMYYPPAWIGIVKTQNGLLSIAASKTCPKDYCYLDQIFLDLKTVTKEDFESSSQCYFNRSGTLCGRCQNGTSLMLGSSACSPNCTNYSLFLLIVFALAGVVLVFIITFLNLTVTMGTINGLIFYANIVQIYSFFLFEKNHTGIASFLKVFIAWLNLDFGIKTCFFKGMDSFSKALLQFAFPVYIWIIAGIIILLSNRYTLMMKIFGKNSVKVLATMILLSYTKIIRATMDTFHFTSLYIHKTGTKSIHWTIDGNLMYLEDKHIGIFIIGVFFAVLSLPFMITLLCIQHLPRLSNWPLFSWIHKLKPFFDSFTGPYTDTTRFWTGLLLLSRIFILAIHSFNIVDSDTIVMAAAVLMCVILLFITSILPRGIYTLHGLNIIEHTFIINLGLLFLGLICSTYYDNYGRVVLVTTSIMIAFIGFSMIILYHVALKFKCLNRFHRWQRRQQNEYIEYEKRGESMGYPPTFDYTEEREPLLTNGGFGYLHT